MTDLVSDFSVHGHFHRHELGIQSCMKDLAEYAKGSIGGQYAGEVDHLMPRRLLRRVSVVCLCHCGGEMSGGIESRFLVLAQLSWDTWDVK
jgi:hypothetical protein